MPLTASGIWYPDGNFTANPRVIAAQQAANLESVITTERLRHGSTNYASVTDRDNANPTPQVGDRCSVAGWPMVYYSVTRGWISLEMRGVGAYMEVTQSTSASVPSSTWTLFKPTTIVEQVNPPNENILTLGATGVIYNKNGFYELLMHCTVSGNTTTGRRLIGWNNSDTATPSGPRESQVPIGGNGNYHSVYLFDHLTDGNGRLAMWMFQDSGAAITVSNIRVRATYRPLFA